MREVLARLRAGELTVDEALAAVVAQARRTELIELGGQARIDLGRTTRRGLPEVVLASGKQPEDVARLVLSLAEQQGQGLASRLDATALRAVELAAEEAGLELLHYGPYAAVARRAGFQVASAPARVAIVTAGTSDLPVAEEARMVLEAVGIEVRLVFDVGVAGLHRLLRPLESLMDWRPDAMVVAAGMDGVLPGVVAGLVGLPVIGLPVSTGYGAGGRGEAALLTMLQSCSTGLAVVNIDNGVGAGTCAALIALGAAAARRPARSRPRPPQAARSPRRRPARPSS